MSAALLVKTPAVWLQRAGAERELLLTDHANCEKKAASTALALMFAYAEDLDLADALSRLAREELRHYEQVAKLMRALGVEPKRLSPGRYAERMRKLVARAEPARQLDLLICGAFIEARSCERFEALAAALPAADACAALFASLHAAEARHNQLYFRLARRTAQRTGLPFERRCGEFAAVEAELITAADPVFRFHSGAPA